MGCAVLLSESFFMKMRLKSSVSPMRNVEHQVSKAPIRNHLTPSPEPVGRGSLVLSVLSRE